jgi:hypothetical protein
MRWCNFGVLFTAWAAVFVVAACQGATAQYFPPTATGIENVRPHFTRYLEGMSEPPLPALSNVDYAVRVTVLIGQREVLTLRMERAIDGAIRATSKKYAFSGNGSLSHVPSRNETRDVSAAEFSHLVDEIQRQDFFSIGPPGFGVTGGSLWLLEVLNGKQYHAAYMPARPTDSQFGLVITMAARIANVPELIP